MLQTAIVIQMGTGEKATFAGLAVLWRLPEVAGRDVIAAYGIEPTGQESAP